MPTTVELDTLLQGDDGRDITLVLGFLQLRGGNIQIVNIGRMVLQIPKKEQGCVRNGDKTVEYTGQIDY